MKAEQLLHAKTLTSVLPIKARLSATVQGGAASRSTRMRFIINTEAFNHFYNPGRDGIHPRSDVYGDAYSGIILCLSPNGSAKVEQTTKTTVYLAFSAKAVAAVENAVAGVEIDAVIATYDDGSKYMLTGPLPDQFLATAVKERRRKDPEFRPLKAAQIAFDHAHVKMPELHPGRSQPAAEPLVPIEQRAVPETAQRVETPASQTASHVEAAAGTIAADFFDKFKDGAKSITDIGDMLTMLNAEAERLRETGSATVLFRIDDAGKIRASAEVAAKFEL